MTAVRPTSQLLPLIGWKETVQLPELQIGALVAKIDTGARGSALHADDITIKGRRIMFRIGLKWHDMPLVGAKRVKSSNGQSETRPIIETEVVLGRHTITTQVTLTHRAVMGVPMLLGREAIKGRFLVHAGRSFLLGRKARKT